MQSLFCKVAMALFKKDYVKQVYAEVLRIFSVQLFYKTTLGNSFRQM